MRVGTLAPIALASWIGVAAGCSGGDKDKDVGSEEGVQAAVDAFQPTILKITTAGLAAKGTSTQGANIPEISFPGAVSGTAAIGGTVAQSSGDNENLSLFVALNEYADTEDVTFQTDNTTDDTKLQFDLQVKNSPQDNSMDGTIAGTLTLDGDVEGTGVFDLTIVSDLEDDDANPVVICTHVTGTVDAADETVTVDFVLPLTLDSAMQATCSQL